MLHNFKTIRDGVEALPLNSVECGFSRSYKLREIERRYLNNHLEQDHRGIKQRYRPMCGFKHEHSAARFCRLFDEIRAFLRPRSQRNQPLSLAQRRRIHQDRFAQLIGVMAAV